MSRLAHATKAMIEEQKLIPDDIVENFMGGDSYKLDPLETLKLIAASSIFGEPSYYRSNIKEESFHPCPLVSDCLLKEEQNKTTTEVFTDAIDAALDYDFEGTLKLAVELRNEYWMRLNPQIIMVRAAIHPKRKEWSETHPGAFNKYQIKVMKRADEPATQLTYYIYLNNGKKTKIPSILKRSIADKLSHLSSYQVAKYKNAEIGMINAVRLTHASSPVLDELMRTGTIKVEDEDETWERMKSRGCSWKEILSTVTMGHMALLRNIRNVFTEIEDVELCSAYMEDLKAGVKSGHQFPFRYESALQQIKADSRINHRPRIIVALNECIDLAMENLPKLKGKTVCLSDNSGSAWGTMTSEYGRTTIAEIDNLSSIIAAKCSDEGYVVKFGDNTIEYPISQRDGILTQTETINGVKIGYDVGRSTEGGIWKFFKKAIEEKIVYDNIFIFSDMQAGTGGLYGTDLDKKEYAKYFCGRGFQIKHRGHTYDASEHINVYKLILEYRKKVNAKVNVFCVQTAGYDNVLVPQMSYRCAMLTGWTGKEVAFAADYIKQWDEIEAKRASKKKKRNEDPNPCCGSAPN